MSTPDIRVRLSPEGLNEVLFALRRLQEEGRRANRGAAEGISAVSAAARELKSLLPTIGLAAAVAGFAALAKQSLATADAMGKLQQGVGGTVEEISGLNLAFRTNESDQEGMRTALFKTGQVLQQVANGSVETIDALKSIGVEAKDIEDLGTPRALEAIARKLVEIPPGGERAAAAMKIFGKEGKNLIVALDAVGTQGIDAFIAKAREMGVLIDEDLARAAARANDALGLIRIQAEGLATQFVSGLAPAVADAMETFGQAISGPGVNGMRTLGETVGFVVRAVVAFFVAMGKQVGATTAKVVTFVEGVVNAAKAIASGDLDGAIEALRESARRRLSIEAELQADLASLREGVFNPQQPAAGRSGGGRAIAEVDTAELKKAHAARLELAKDAVQNELKLQQERLKSEEQANKRAYDQGLISLEEYFTRRHQIAVDGAEAELAALKLQRGQVAGELAGAANLPEADRIKLRQDLARVEAEIAARQIQAQRELAEIAAEEIEAQKAQASERVKIANTLDDLEGKRHAVFQRNLEEEVKTLRELGVRAGQTAEEIEETVGRLTAARTAQFNFEDVQRKAKAALDAYTRDAEQIRRDQESGLITQYEGEQRLIELTRQRLVLLRQIADASEEAAKATGSDEAIEKAKEYADSVKEIEVSYQAATDMATRFKNAGLESFEGALSDLLQNVDKIDNLGEAFKNLARTVAQALAKMAADIIAKQATLALARAFFNAASGGSGSAAGAIAGAHYGGYIRGYATGGDVRGRALRIPGPDKIPILAQEGEFMMRRARVQEPGALDFLRAWNSGRVSLAQVMQWPRFATGGQIGAAPGAPSPSAGPQSSGRSQMVRIVNVLSPDLVNDALASSAGEETLLNVVRRNSSTIKRMLSS